MNLMNDEELNKLIKRKNQEKWFELFLILCELSDKETIERVTYNKNELYIRNSDGKTSLYLI